jgi:diguanylate cyclase (GGDEF)-like protein/PAS domain S-box-containing protein
MKFLAASRRWKITHGFGDREIRGLSYYELFPNVPERWKAYHQRGLAGEVIRMESDQTEMEEGLVRLIRWEIRPWRTANDRVGGIVIFVDDITESVRAEEALRESSDFLKEAQRIGNLGCFILDVTTRVWTSTGQLDEMFGLDASYPRTVEGWDALVHPEDRAIVHDYFAGEVVGQAKAFDKEYRIVRPSDGETRWVHCICRLEFDGLGRPTLMRGTMRDITLHKQAEMAIEEREKLFHAITESSPLAYVITSGSEDRIDYLNPAFIDLFGYTQAEIQTSADWSLLAYPDAEYRAWALAEWQRKIPRNFASSNATEPIEVEITCKDGAKKNVVWGYVQLGERNLAYGLDITEQKRATRALQESEVRYRSAFQTSIDPMTISRLDDGRFIEVNQAFLRTFACARQEVIGKTSLELDIWQSAADRKRLADTLRAHSVCHDLEFQLNNMKGQCLLVLVSGALMELDGVASFLLVVRDITEARAAEEQLAAASEALRRSEKRYRTAFQTSTDAININRLSDGLYVDCNHAFLEILGYTREEVIGKTSLELNVWADARDRLAMVEVVRQNSSCRGLEVRFKHKNGEIVWGEMSASLIEIDGAECILSVTRDISHMKTAENTIRNLAFYDSLTGLPNRRFLFENLNQIQSAVRAGHSQALLFVELDQFKTLNETLGYLTGNLLLKEIARRICACVGPFDIVCRMGGDEFAVMLDDLSESVEEAAAQSRDVGERIRVSIEAPCSLNGRECITTASIGCTVFGADQKSTDELMQEADIALYQAKLAGRNTMRFFSPALQLAVNARATLDEDLRLAIKGRQFLLYYQPQVERGRLIGAEALIRWLHPRNGLVPPDAFIPLAEETGLILPVGDWVLDAACRQIAAWAGRKDAAHLTVAVNISALQFRRPGFVETVLQALRRSGANPKNLKLELTESMLVDNIEDVITKMTVLKEHGLSFSLDDFGTGYSSLAYLKRLPLDQLKIDRAFVRDMLVDVTSGAIAQTVISLGGAMGLSVIAEGVETEEQRGFLAGLGCHSFQGMLFSPPLSLEEFEAFIHEIRD